MCKKIETRVMGIINVTEDLFRTGVYIWKRGRQLSRVRVN